MLALLGLIPVIGAGGFLVTVVSYALGIFGLITSFFR